MEQFVIMNYALFQIYICIMILYVFYITFYLKFTF